MLEQICLLVCAIDGMLMGAVLGLHERATKPDLEAVAARLVTQMFRVEPPREARQCLSDAAGAARNGTGTLH